MIGREFTRRDFQRISLASAFGAAACPWLPRLAAAADKKPAKACIVLWMGGGPTQTDTWDLKPDSKNGGPYKELATAVPGIKISEHLPKLAAAAKDLGIIRSMATKEGEHGRATQLLHTGQLPSEAVLLKEFETSRITVVRALRELQQRGLVQRRAGSGTYVANGAAENASRLFGLLIPNLGETEIFGPICESIAEFLQARQHALLWGNMMPAGQAKETQSLELCRQ